VEYHLANNRRVTPIVAIADLGWSISTHGKDWTLKGNHGYDNNQPDMMGIAIGYGPQFNQISSLLQPLQIINVDLYNLMCRILAVPSSPNNGTWASVDNLFKS